VAGGFATGGAGSSPAVPVLALTFDDGPDPAWTPRLLDLLRRLGARATFFPIASRAAAHPEIIERIRSEGHAIGLHCDEHVRHNERDAAWLERDTDAALKRLAALGVRPAFWRTPWGDVAPWSTQVARDRDLRLIGWTADTHDWRGDSAAEMFEATGGALTGGAIILAHDGLGPGARRHSQETTLDYVTLVGEHAREHGLSLEALL
jgi:peptidoglycan-N-acetylglucosamine deacetylase